MSFTANYAFRSLIQTALASDLPAHVTAVASEQSVTLPAVRANYTSEREDMLFPSTLLAPQRGDIEDAGALVTNCEAWVLISATHTRPEMLEQMMTGYLTALVRTFDRATLSGHLFEVRSYDMSPPTISEAETLQTAAVLVAATIIEAA